MYLEAQSELFLSAWVLFSPEFEQQRRHDRQCSFRAVYFGVTGWTKRDHQVQDRLPRNPVVHDDLALPSSRRIADTTPVAIPFENDLTQTVEVFRILALEAVASRTHAERKHLRPPTTAMHRGLSRSLHPLLRSRVR